MEDERRRLLIAKRVKKHRVIQADVEAAMAKRSRQHLRIGKPIFFFINFFKVSFNFLSGLSFINIFVNNYYTVLQKIAFLLIQECEVFFYNF